MHQRAVGVQLAEPTLVVQALLVVVEQSYDERWAAVVEAMHHQHQQQHQQRALVNALNLHVS